MASIQAYVQLNHLKLIAQCYLIAAEIGVVIPNLAVLPKDPHQFREVSFILAKQLHHFHS